MVAAILSLFATSFVAPAARFGSVKSARTVLAKVAPRMNEATASVDSFSHTVNFANLQDNRKLEGHGYDYYNYGRSPYYSNSGMHNNGYRGGYANQARGMGYGTVMPTGMGRYGGYGMGYGGYGMGYGGYGMGYGGYGMGNGNRAYGQSGGMGGYGGYSGYGMGYGPSRTGYGYGTGYGGSYGRGSYGGSYGTRGYGSHSGYGGYSGYSGYSGYGGRDAMHRMSTRPFNNFNGGYMRDYNYMRAAPYGGYGGY